MSKRISIVKNVRILSIELASIFEVGDSIIANPKSNIFAIQREVPFFWGDEGRLNEYATFTKPIKNPVIDEDIKINTINILPTINVKNIKILGLSAASIMQIGSNKIIAAESRIINIRQLISE